MSMFRRTRGGLALTLAIGLTLLALIVGVGILAYNGRTVFADGNPHPAAPTATPVPPTPTTDRCAVTFGFARAQHLANRDAHSDGHR